MNRSIMPARRVRISPLNSRFNPAIRADIPKKATETLNVDRVIAVLLLCSQIDPG